MASPTEPLSCAEKRAAIDAVLSRLVGAELGDIVLDIHEGTRDRLRIAHDLGGTLVLAQQPVAAEPEGRRRRLAVAARHISRNPASGESDTEDNETRGFHYASLPT